MNNKDNIVGYLGHKPWLMAMHFKAVAEAEPGKALPLKALLGVVAVKGVAAAKAMLAAGAAEYAIA